MDMNNDNDIIMTGGREVEAEPMEMDDSSFAPGRSRRRHGHMPPNNLPIYGHPEDIRESSETRERRHAAISILNDPELLMFHALSSNEVCTHISTLLSLSLPLFCSSEKQGNEDLKSRTGVVLRKAASFWVARRKKKKKKKRAKPISLQSIPQTRRRFLHHLIGITPPTTRPFAIRDLSRYRSEDSHHVYVRRQPQSSSHDHHGSGSNRSGYTAYEQAPTMIDIIEINGGWETDAEGEGAANKSRNGSSTCGSARSGGGASPGPSGRVKGKGRG
uniref:Uncharacterized protein n=1 Tax=Coccidioides posadasii RMSCC 3488 TaxID=454284 RepID=A0A0J6FN03_COCPO|nr:hypothetical protein CPAG_07141 [Coccidioides posadasii RMSCC 3488]